MHIYKVVKTLYYLNSVKKDIDIYSILQTCNLYPSFKNKKRIREIIHFLTSISYNKISKDLVVREYPLFNITEKKNKKGKIIYVFKENKYKTYTCINKDLLGDFVRDPSTYLYLQQIEIETSF